MIYFVFFSSYFFFFFYILNINLLYTIYFSYISFLNFVDSNLSFLTIFFLFFIGYRRLIMLCFFLYKFKVQYNFIFIKSLIPNLVVGTILIHPLIFYFSISLTFVICFFFTFKIFSKLRVRQLILICSLSFSMFLGGLWSLQSNSWGYFWVNDLIEWFLFFFIFFLVFQQHFVKTTTISFFYYLLFYFFFNFLIFLRIGLFTTRHSFLPSGFYTMLIPLVITYFYFYLNTFFFFRSHLQRFLRHKSFFVFFISIKWFILIIMSYFIKKNIIKNLRFFKVHFFLFLFIVVWNVVFFFFDGIFFHYNYTSFFKLNIFSSSVKTNFLFLLNNFNTILLNYVNFFLSNLSFFITKVFLYSLFLTLNNYFFLFLIAKLFFFLRKIVWI